MCQPDLFPSPLLKVPYPLGADLIDNPAQSDLGLLNKSTSFSSALLEYFHRCPHVLVGTIMFRVHDICLWVSLLTLHPMILGATNHLTAKVNRIPEKSHHSEVAQNESMPLHSLMLLHNLASKQRCLCPEAYVSFLLFPFMLLSTCTLF